MPVLLAWSLRYVTVFADDIRAARRELDRLEARRDRLVAADAGLPDADRRQRRRTRLKAYFGRRRREGRGAPIWGTAHNGTLRVDPDTGAVTPPINAHLLHLHAGIERKSVAWVTSVSVRVDLCGRRINNKKKN